MNNPLRILQTLDRHLTVPAELTVFGRAVLALGYANSPPGIGARRDVDAILPMAWLQAARLLPLRLERGEGRGEVLSALLQR